MSQDDINGSKFNERVYPGFTALIGESGIDPAAEFDKRVLIRDVLTDAHKTFRASAKDMNDVDKFKMYVDSEIETRLQHLREAKLSADIPNQEAAAPLSMAEKLREIAKEQEADAGAYGEDMRTEADIARNEASPARSDADAPPQETVAQVAEEVAEKAPVSAETLERVRAAALEAQHLAEIEEALANGGAKQPVDAVAAATAAGVESAPPQLAAAPSQPKAAIMPDASPDIDTSSDSPAATSFGDIDVVIPNGGYTSTADAAIIAEKIDANADASASAPKAMEVPAGKPSRPSLETKAAGNTNVTDTAVETSAISGSSGAVESIGGDAVEMPQVVPSSDYLIEFNEATGQFIAHEGAVLNGDMTADQQAEYAATGNAFLTGEYQRGGFSAIVDQVGGGQPVAMTPQFNQYGLTAAEMATVQTFDNSVMSQQDFGVQVERGLSGPIAITSTYEMAADGSMYQDTGPYQEPAYHQTQQQQAFALN